MAVPGSDDPRITAFGLLLEATAAVAGAVGADLQRSSSLPIAEFEVLLRLARSADLRLRMSELAGQVGLSTSGLTRLVDRMEAAGLVRREACPSDRRGLHAVLAERGEELLGAVLAEHLDSLERHLAAPLGRGGLADLETGLRCLRDSVRS